MQRPLAFALLVLVLLLGPAVPAARAETAQTMKNQPGYLPIEQLNLFPPEKLSVEVNIELQLGATTETIEVTATTPLLSTAEASLGQVVDERRVLELPQFAGNAMDLVHLAPGTIARLSRM